MTLIQSRSSLVVYGNQKISRQVALFDLPAKHTCLNHAHCWRTCYAYKQQQYWHLAEIRNTRYQATLLPEFVERMVELIKKKPYCRPHTSGDFYSQEYVDKWITIMEACPNTQFFGFTKVKNILNFSSMNALPNVNMISSILPDGQLNYGGRLILHYYQDLYDCHVCQVPYPYPRGYCMSQCHACLTAKMVIFEQHGSRRGFKK